MPRERHKQTSCKAESTNTLYRGGLTGSSDEALVMSVERSSQLIQLIDLINQNIWEEFMKEAKSFIISKHLVMEAW